MLGAGQQESTADQPSPNIASPAGLRVAGVVGAGLWIETGTDSNEPRTLHVPADPRYPAQDQSGYEIRGTSTDKFARPGDFLIVVDRAAVGLPLRSGDIVLVTRIKKDLREVTVRRFQRSSSDCELHFESTDPRYNNWLVLPNDLGDDAVILGGIAVGVYRPLT
jgi:SOS-response transcriptional repressor LexA